MPLWEKLQIPYEKFLANTKNLPMPLNRLDGTGNEANKTYLPVVTLIYFCNVQNNFNMLTINTNRNCLKGEIEHQYYKSK